MKKIIILIVLTFPFYLFGQNLNMGAVLSGKTPDVICFVTSAQGDAQRFEKIECANRNGQLSGRNQLSAQANELFILTSFVGSGSWNLATAYQIQNRTVYIFTRK